MLIVISVFIFLFCSLHVQAQTFLDQRFGNNGVVILDSLGFEGAWNSALQSDGSIIVTGWRHKTFFGKNDILIARFTPNGVLDTSFRSGTFLTNPNYPWQGAYDVIVQDDDKILVVGRSFNNSSWDFFVMRLLPDGSFDNTFGKSGIVVIDSSPDDRAFAIDLQKDGKILVAGLSTLHDWDFAVLRLNPDGSPDLSFGENGKVFTDINGGNDVAFSIKTLDDGRIIACGWSLGLNDYDFTLVRYNHDGSLDLTFGNNGIVTTDLFNRYNSAHSVEVQADGKYVVAGYTYREDRSDYDIVVLRYNTDGTLDHSFGEQGIVITDINNGNEFAWKIALQKNNKIVVSGFYISNSVKSILVLRYNPDGSPDITFADNGVAIVTVNGIDEEGRGIVIQPDNKILISGYSFNGQDIDLVLIRLNNFYKNIPAENYQLFQNFPNPFNSLTKIPFQLGEPSFVKLKVYDALGREVMSLLDEYRSAGYFEVDFNAEELGSGIYFYELRTGSETQTGKMVIVK